MTVYVVQEPLRRDETGTLVPRINYGTLKPYGDVKFIFTWGCIKDTDTLGYLEMDWYRKRAREALRNFSDDDYILPTGHPALIATVVLEAARVNGRFKMLDWSRERKDYRIVAIDDED